MTLRMLAVLAMLCACLGTAQAQNQAEIFPQLGHSYFVASVAFSPDGARIASGASNVAIEVWDTASGTLLASLRIWDGMGLAYTPAGLFVGDADPQDAFAIVRGFEVLPLDDFIALDRRDSLAEALGVKSAAAK